MGLYSPRRCVLIFAEVSFRARYEKSSLSEEPQKIWVNLYRRTPHFVEKKNVPVHVDPVEMFRDPYLVP